MQTRDSKGRFTSTNKSRFTTRKIESEKSAVSGAYYTVERDGQEEPDEGDRILVKCTIHLPASNGHIDKSLHFFKRATIMDSFLCHSWGDKIVPNYLSRSVNFINKKWRDAFLNAAQYAQEEIQKLDDALIARAKALEDAEY